MTKKIVESKVRCNGTMSESQYLSWIRSALRSKSLKWPPRAKALELARRPYKGDNKLQKWEYQCAICNNWFKAKEVVVDHFPKSAGSILKWQDIGEFCNNLYCETDNLRVLCSADHDTHTLSEKLGISFEDARVEQEIIAICKKPVKEILDFAASYGYTSEQCSNPEKRRKVVSEIIRSVE